MFPYRYSSIFRNRWMALLWAAGILWFALDVSTPTPNAGKADTQNFAAATANIPAKQQAALNAFAAFADSPDKSR